MSDVMRLFGNLAGQAGRLAQNGNALQLVSDYVAYIAEARKQEVEQKRILAVRDVALASIDAEKQIILDYFDKRFAERRQALESCFGALDRAIAERNDRALDAALTALATIVQDNPLRDFEKFREARKTDQIMEI